MSGCRRPAGQGFARRLRAPGGAAGGVPYQIPEGRYSGSRIVRGARLGDPPAVRVGPRPARTPKTASTPG